jgi:serine-type D-Ala-D-Ala carboxypeptidase (penicillin-binding protein 5/6)
VSFGPAARLLATALCLGGVALLSGAPGAIAGARVGHHAAGSQTTTRPDADDRPTATPGGSLSPPHLAVTAAAVYAPATGQLLYGVNPDREVAIASATKLMTALITVEHVHRLSTTFAQNSWDPAADDSQIGLAPGERMSVHDLLLAMMLPSADDAAEDLAYNVGHGSVARFVAMMNAEARALGLTHTHYTTPIGLDTPGNYSTARDLVRLAAYDLSHSAYLARIVDLPGAVLRSGSHVRTVVNLNDLVRTVPWIDGVKTGHTSDAGYVLVASGHRDGMSLISAVLGTSSESERDTNTLALLDYGFAAFRPRTPVHAGRAVERAPVVGWHGVRVALVARRTFTRVLPVGAALRERVQLARKLRGPLAAGTVVGAVVVYDGGQALARVPVALASRIAAPPSAPIAAHLVGAPLLLALASALLLALGARARRVRRRAHDYRGGRA